jgi:hypothetical protein
VDVSIAFVEGLGDRGTHTGSVEEVEAPVAEVVERWETAYLKTGWGFIEGDLAG